MSKATKAKENQRERKGSQPGATSAKLPNLPVNTRKESAKVAPADEPSIPEPMNVSADPAKACRSVAHAIRFGRRIEAKVKQYHASHGYDEKSDRLYQSLSQNWTWLWVNKAELLRVARLVLPIDRRREALAALEAWEHTDESLDAPALAALELLKELFHGDPTDDKWSESMSLKTIASLLGVRDAKLRTIEPKLTSLGSELRTIDRQSHQVRLDTLPQPYRDKFKA